ncbi:MAG: M14 family metallopeptidase, partial [candidate division KSB1 bacterium]|nr:M14 family metallopeptidase [candidate division KSB1 bacterium]
MRRWKPISIITGLVILTALMAASTPYSESHLAQADTGSQGDTTLVRVYYPDPAMGRSLFVAFEAQVLETNYEAGYHLMEVTADDIARLTAVGARVEPETERKLADYYAVRVQPLAQTEGIPGYPCYRTVEETFADAQAIANAHPNLATWTDQGNSWEKSAGLGGYDMMVLRLTNSAIPGPKPKLFINGAIHAREYTPAELAMRFAEYLVNNYGTDADVTWILDYHEVHIMPHANPDGRKKAEAGLSWRKNTNQNYCGATSNNRGADLNRNFPFKWGCCGGSSGNPCDATYRGPSPASEPETQAIRDYMRALFPDQRGSGDSDPAPADATGVYIDLHSYSQLVLWPWGYTSAVAPNGTQLQTLGRKFAYWNGYTPQQSMDLYATDGTTDDFIYGELGVAGYCFELGTAFFQACSTFENTIVPNNMPALIYAAKVARTPYMTPAGPDAYNLALSQDNVPAGTNVTLSATVNDTRYNNSNGTEPTQNIAAAEYYVDVPPWQSGSIARPMSASDGSFNAKTENVQATVDTTGLSQGKHIIFVRGKDANNNWGAFSAIFLNITAGGPTPTPTSTPTNTPTPTPTPTPTNTPTPTPTPTQGPGVVFSDDFVTNQGWTVNPNGNDTATIGKWERADPQDTNYSGPKQLGTTTSGSYDL